MNASNKHRGMIWAYRKIRSLHVSPASAGYRALRYVLCGDTGNFLSHGGWQKSRIRRD